ncbi:DUF443 family protein [Paraliobacillus sp. JSM ZJ581]|uniref:DUF443 family protein n=1 Tax=Paraliobacillus sp. JSM ZJ581 TaxID=3342118 RepID=UPI0035A8A3B9
MNTRFRVLKVEGGNTYTIDMSQSVWKIMFPFLTWILTNTVYQVDEEVLDEKIGSVKNNTKTNKVSILLTTGISITIANLLEPLTDYFYFESTIVINSIIAITMLILVATMRFYLSHRNKKDFYKKIGPYLVSRKSIWIRPQSFKHVIKCLSAYFFTLIFSLFMFIFFITYSNVVGLIITMIFWLILSILNGTTVIEGTTTIKFKEKKVML